MPGPEDLVEPAAKHKTRSTDRIREVRTEEKKLYGKINKRMGQLGREVEEKESEIQKEKQKATAMEEELEKKAQKLNETAARLGTAEEAKKTANEKIKELETEVRELKKELAKPPPVPPMTKEEADKELRNQMASLRVELAAKCAALDEVNVRFTNWKESEREFTRKTKAKIKARRNKRDKLMKVQILSSSLLSKCFPLIMSFAFCVSSR
jgi:DNA repair exonuclease SbcCD ATPase subunit